MSVPAVTEQATTTRLSKFSDLSRRVVDAINRNPSLIFVTIAVVYFGIAVGISSFRLFWFDELVTFYVSKLGSARAIWAALAHGADPNPPLSHLLVMWSMRIFGDGQIAVRLPAMLASFVGVWSLYRFLRPRLPVIFVASGVFFYIATHAMDYSYESRSYAFMLGFAMLSLLMWRAAIEGRHQLLATVGLTIALAAGISSNYYGVLAFFPIAAGELVRMIENRKLESRIWIALAIASASLIPYLPLVHTAVSRFAPFAWNKPHIDFIYNSFDSLIDTLVIPTVLLLLAGLAMYLIARFRSEDAKPLLPRHEFAAVAVQMLYPVIAYAIAVARAGMVSPRFVLPICFSVSIAVAITAARLFSKNAVAAVVLLFVCTSWAIARNAQTAMELLDQRQAMFNLRDRLPDKGMLIVSDSLLALPLVHYATPQAASRIEFPLDLAAVREYKHDDSAEQNLLGGGSIFPLRVVPVSEMTRRGETYTIVAGRDNWLIKKFEASGIRLEKVASDPGARLINNSFAPLGAAEPFFFVMPAQDAVASANGSAVAISQ